MAGKRGKKPADRSGWFHPGGGFPLKVKGLTKEQHEHYTDLRKRCEMVGIGGAADLPVLIHCARIGARCDQMSAQYETMDRTDPDRLKHLAELGKQESRYKDLLAALYLTPRARGSARLNTNELAHAKPEEDGDSLPALLKLRRNG